MGGDPAAEGGATAHDSMQVPTSATGYEEEAQAAATGHEEAQATATGQEKKLPRMRRTRLVGSGNGHRSGEEDCSHRRYGAGARGGAVFGHRPEKKRRQTRRHQSDEWEEV